MRSAFDDRRWPSIARWLGAAAFIVAAHAGGAWFITNWKSAEPDVPGAPPTIMIDLAPVATSLDVPEQDVAVGPQTVEATSTPETEKPLEEEPLPEEPAEEIVEPQKVEPEDIEPTPEPKEEELVEHEELPVVESAEVTLPDNVPVPLERPDWLEDRPKTPTPRKTPTRVTQRKPPSSQTTAPASSDARKDHQTAAPSTGVSASPSISPARWQSLLNAHLNRFKRFPSGASRGIVYVRFTVDIGGRVTGIRLAGTSGDGRLDQAAVDLVQRASPVPPPPASLLRGSSVLLTVPVNYMR